MSLELGSQSHHTFDAPGSDLAHSCFNMVFIITATTIFLVIKSPRRHLLMGVMYFKTSMRLAQARESLLRILDTLENPGRVSGQAEVLAPNPNFTHMLV